MPDLAEKLLDEGLCDLVAMARPFLADGEFMKKAREGRVDEINTCIACNQACLDHTFVQRTASCLVNPRACHESEIVIKPAEKPKSLAVVGAGPAGLAFATTAAECGHSVTLFDKASEIGGQFNMARIIPGKEEFNETLRYFRRKIELTGVKLELGKNVEAADLLGNGFDEVVLATGVTPRELSLEGINHPSVLSYVDILRNGAKVGKKVAIIGAGGIGYDVAEFLLEEHEPPNTKAFFKKWGVDPSFSTRGSLAKPVHDAPKHDVTLLQRSEGKLGAKLGKTTGWIHRTSLKHFGVKTQGGVTYQRIDDDGLHILVGDQPKCLDVDTVIICAGQVSLRELLAPLEVEKMPVHLIGGADVAGELDAKRAIDQGTRLGVAI
jgi:2,4-dienoyl-CoA reductase (NADPH2)